MYIVVFWMVLSNLSIPQVRATYIYAISSTECCKRYFKILIVEKINVYAPLNEGSHSRYRTYSTPIFPVNEAQKLWCPEVFHKKSWTLPSGMEKASAREFRIPTVWVFPWAAASNWFSLNERLFFQKEKRLEFWRFSSFHSHRRQRTWCLWLQCCKYASRTYTLN